MQGVEIMQMDAIRIILAILAGISILWMNGLI